MEHPFIDARELTNEDLQQRIQKLQNILYKETMFGHAGMVDSIRDQLIVYEQEFSERVYMQRVEEFEKKFPDETIEIGVIEEIEETDPNANIEIPVKRQKDL